MLNRLTKVSTKLYFMLSCPFMSLRLLKQWLNLLSAWLCNEHALHTLWRHGSSSGFFPWRFSLQPPQTFKKVPESFLVVSASILCHFQLFSYKNNDILLPKTKNSSFDRHCSVDLVFDLFWRRFPKCYEQRCSCRTVLCTRSDALNSPGSGYPDCHAFILIP